MSKVHNPVSVKNNQVQSLKENSQTRKLPAKIYRVHKIGTENFSGKMPLEFVS